MFLQMVKGALIRQKNRFALIALTVAPGVSLAAAMLNVMFDVGDKVNQELKAYGANITVTPKNSALLKDVYGLEAHEYLNESDLGKIKTIFRTNNIVAFAPKPEGTLTLDVGGKISAATRSRPAAVNPDLLSQQEKEIWYCTAYVSSIAYQIEEVISNSSARPVRQIAESERKILEKTQLLILLITALPLLSTALGVSNLVSANIMERSRELGLLKAIGATNLGVILLVLTEIFIAGLGGGVLGYAVSLGLAQIIGTTVFGSAIVNNAAVLPIVSVLMVAVLLVGSLPAIRMLLSLQPAEVLHGR